MTRLEHSHDPISIQHRLFAKRRANYLRDFIYGSIDGTVTTFAIVAGVVGANMSNKTIIILGLANVLADGFSMASSNYLGTKSENDEAEKIRQYELNQLREFPTGEVEEIRQIFLNKGFTGIVLEKIVETIVKDEGEWLKIMLQEEYGLGQNNRNPMLSGFTTFISFAFFGVMPIVPFIIKIDSPFYFSSLIAGISFFVIGTFKSRWSLEHYLLSGLKTFALGMTASFIAYFAGYFLEKLIT